MNRRRRDFLKTSAVGTGTAAGILDFPVVARTQAKKLTVWWDRSYYKEEDEALLQIAEEFRKIKNVDLDISLHGLQGT